MVRWLALKAPGGRMQTVQYLKYPNSDILCAQPNSWDTHLRKTVKN